MGTHCTRGYPLGRAGYPLWAPTKHPARLGLGGKLGSQGVSTRVFLVESGSWVSNAPDCTHSLWVAARVPACWATCNDWAWGAAWVAWVRLPRFCGCKGVGGHPMHPSLPTSRWWSPLGGLLHPTSRFDLAG